MLDTADLKAWNMMPCPFGDTCLLERSRLHQYHADVVAHRESAESTWPAPESLIWLWDEDRKAANDAHGWASSVVQARLKSDHEYWDRGIITDGFDEEAERQRLRPI